MPGPRYEFLMRWRKTAPLLTMKVDGQTLDPRYLLASARWDGKDQLVATDAGTGTAADYEGRDVRGLAVLVSRTDALTPAQQARTAHAAGAAMLVVVNDRPGRLDAYAGGTELPVVTLTQAEGQPLLDRLGRDELVELRLDGTEQAPYVYDLQRTADGEIPADLAWSVTEDELATITNRFVGEPGQLALESRAACRDWFWPPCMRSWEPVHLGTERVDYVSTQDGTDWYESMLDVRGWEQRTDRRSHTAGEQRTHDWFEPVTRPRTGPGFWYPRRDGNFFAVNVPHASTGVDGVTGIMEDESTVVTRLYADGQVVRSGPFQAVQARVPDVEGWGEYRFEMDTTRPELWDLSTRTATAWDFRAQTTVEADRVNLPLLQLDYHLDTDLTGTLAGGARQTIGLCAVHNPGAAGAGVPTTATLEVSYDDGTTWQRAELDPERAGSWSATVRIDARATHLSLRATVSDDAGNRVTQEVIRAAGVR